MAISPISSVSFNNYNNVTFAGKRDKENRHSSHTTTPVKAVPLAVLLAMSPVSTNVYANDPIINGIEQVEGLNSLLQNQKVPFPSHFTYLNKYLVDMPNNEKCGLIFIDSNGDKNNYEYFEYIHLDSNGNVQKRGLITHVKFRPAGENYDRSIVLNGIALDKNDLDDYAPKGLMREHLMNTEFFDFVARIIDNPANNRAFVRMPNGVSYGGPETYVKYLRKYEADLGID